jgi:Family of unknown function (DUF5684)
MKHADSGGLQSRQKPDTVGNLFPTSNSITRGTTMLELSLLFAQGNVGNSGAATAASALVSLVFFGICFAIMALVFAGMWRIFEKAGKPGWACLIPIYNGIVLLEIVEKPIWWIILYFIPCVQFVIGILVSIELANKFGKDIGFAIGLILLPVIFIPILGFGDARYRGRIAMDDD